MYAGHIAVFELVQADTRGTVPIFRGRYERWDPTPASIRDPTERGRDCVRVSWDAPGGSGDRSILGVVELIHLWEDFDKVFVQTPPQEITIQAPDNRIHFDEWSFGKMVFVIVLPRGWTIKNAGIPYRGVKLHGDALAFYWILEPGQINLYLEVAPFEGTAEEALIQAARKSPRGSTRTASVVEVDGGFDYLLVTSTQREAEAVIAAMGHGSPRAEYIDCGWRGYGDRRVAWVRTEMGSLALGVQLSGLLTKLQVRRVLAVGILAGLREARTKEEWQSDAEFQTFGDVVMATGVIPYANEAYRANDVVEDRNIAEHADSQVTTWARHQNWSGLPKNGLGEPARLHLGRILSGPLLVADSAKRDELIAQSKGKKPIGLEMEAEGLAVAVRHSRPAQWVCVKGICDFAGKKSDDWQPMAAANAMAVAARIIDAAPWDNRVLRGSL
jgi:nucleoside phosphorylase